MKDVKCLNYYGEEKIKEKKRYFETIPLSY